MKAVVIAFLLLTLAVLALPSPANAASPSPCNSTTACKATITRTIATNSWGVTIVTDKVSMNSTSPVSQLMIGVPTNVSRALRVSQANDTSGTNLAISTLPNQTFTALTVLFPSLVKSYSFTLRTAYWGLLTYNGGYTFSVNPFPVVDSSTNATVITTFTYTGGWAAPKIAPPQNATLSSSAYKVNINPFNTTIWKITFSSATSQNLFSVAAGRIITITPSDSVQVTDQYNVTNLGATVSSITLTVPASVSSISESYVLGLQIDQPSTTPTPTANADGTSTVTFTPSFGSLPFNQTVKAKISYVLSPTTYVSSGSLGSFTLNFALFNNVQFYSPMIQTKIVKPTGFRLNAVSGQTPQTSSSQVLFQSANVSPLSNLGFSISYQLDPFWSTVSPLTWAALLELALAASVIAVGWGTGAAGPTGVPVQTITKFVDLYDEKSSMGMESDKMEDDLARGGLNKYDYRQRRRNLDRRMGEIDRALAGVKSELVAESPRYADMTKRIERAEAELQVIRTTSADLKNQYRAGKISRDLYDSLSADLVRRKQRAQQTIDTVIINLREEIR